MLKKPRQSQIVDDIIAQEKSISYRMREKALKQQAKDRERFKHIEEHGHSLVDEMADRYKKELTPAEKGKLTKSKNAAKKAMKEKIAREKADMEKATILKHKREAELREFYGSRT